VVDHGQPVSDTTIKFIPTKNAPVVPIMVNGKQVGQLILNPKATPPQRRITFGFLQPVLLVSGFLALLTILIGLLLTRRVVTPLADVISAAKQVADGNLRTRVSVQGPHDMRALSDSFNQMADALERNDRERRDMLADIAHELRTPLSVLRGRLEGVMDGVYKAVPSSVAAALEETYLLERLVEDLRILTLAETRQLPFEKRPLDLNDVAQRVIRIFQAQADEHHVDLTLQATEKAAMASLDPQRAEQIVGNLVSNALRHAPDNDGKVWLEVRSEGDSVSISISDNGSGVDEEDLPNIFNRFWRGDKSRTRSSGGAGLGLAISRQLVEAQDGKISARNRPEGGLQVTCQFPLSQ
jgi:signal transduction histidine kinase